MPEKPAWPHRSHTLADAIEHIAATAPNDGTSWENLFVAVGEMTPPPDNLFLIVDSFPTQGTCAPEPRR